MRFTSFADRNAIEAEAAWRQVAAGLPDTVYGVLTRSRDRFPNARAVTFQMTSGPTDPAETLSWSAFHARVTQTANLFRSLGVGPNDVVSYILPNCTETATVLVAGMTEGVVNPVNPLLEPSQIAAILRESGSTVVVTLKSLPKSNVAQKVAEALEHAPGVRTVLEVDLNRYLTGTKSWLVPFIRPKVEVHHRARVLNFHREVSRMPSDRLTFPEPSPDRIAALFHTGGTTGMPKLARHRQAGMIYNGWIGTRLLFDPTDVLICPLPLFHVMAAHAVMMSVLVSGAHVVFPTPQGYRGDGVMKNFWKLVERWGVTFLITVPTAASALLQRKVNADVSSLRIGLSGSAALPMSLYQRFESATDLQLAEGYGLTEATCLVSCNPPGGLKKVGSVGIPFPHTQVRILRFDVSGTILHECTTDEVGEICVRNPGVNQDGIYGGADSNRNTMTEDGFLRTGDLGRLDADGYLWITGRAKDLIIRGGHNIDPAQIEDALLSHPEVAFAGAVGQPDAVGGELPCVYVELIEGGTVTVSDLAAHARTRLQERAAYPKHIEILPELPKTAVGKVFKPDLRRRAILRVLNAALVRAGLQAEIIAVVEDRKRGLTARVRVAGHLDHAALDKVLGEFTVPWEMEP
jgi:acyl-CoA synthetase (AMP-forming)/AMP-acid ligase II